jgi:TolB-like protein
VLPLTNLSADPEQEYFADGMTGELSRINSLKIISRTSVMQYKGEKRKSLENGTPRQLLGDEEDVGK